MSDKSFIQLTLSRTGNAVLVNVHHIVRVVANANNSSSANVILAELTAKGTNKTIFVRESYEDISKRLTGS